MGCRQSNSYEIDDQQHDARETKDEFYKAESSIECPICPLDDRQIFKLKKSWKGVKRKIQEAGVEMFVR